MVAWQVDKPAWLTCVAIDVLRGDGPGGAKNGGTCRCARGVLPKELKHGNVYTRNEVWENGARGRFGIGREDG